MTRTGSLEICDRELCKITLLCSFLQAMLRILFVQKNASYAFS